MYIQGIHTLEVIISEVAIFASLAIYVESTSFGSIARTAPAITRNTPAMLPKRLATDRTQSNQFKIHDQESKKTDTDS